MAKYSVVHERELLDLRERCALAIAAWARAHAPTVPEEQQFMLTDIASQLVDVVRAVPVRRTRGAG